MKSCGACKVLKEELGMSKIKFIDMDIDEHVDLWDEFTSHTGIGYVPSIYIVEEDADSGVSLSPGKDFNDPIEALKKIIENL
jgi:hypothetical protein